MKNFVYIALILLCFSCEKNEFQAKVPLHQNSYKWFMSNFPLAYTNAQNDTVKSISNSVDINYLAKQNVQYEVKSQDIVVDTLLGLNYTLISQIIDEERKDSITIETTNFVGSTSRLTGIAQPLHYLHTNATTTYLDSITLNGKNYRGVYRNDLSAEQQLFINAATGLVGFTHNKDTFNLVN